MTKRTFKFTGTDAWVLLALIYSSQSRTADLTTVIASADFINHAILTYDELRNGLGRLEEAGLIREKSGKYRATSIVLAAYAKTTTPRRAVLKELQDIHTFLATRVHEPLALRPSKRLSRTAYREAVRNYQQLSQK